MVSFSICLLALVVGYFVYGRVVERIFGPDPGRKTPALERPDGVDYVVLPRWKIFMIQFLNIAGLGPIFGAILGAKFGVSSYLWIVLGTLFAGAVHDYTAGMLSLRYGGKSLPELIGMCLGKYAKQLMVIFTVVLMVLVGAVFVDGPAQLLTRLTPEHLDTTFWIVVVFAYYILATLLPIDKIIGRIYPVFGAALLFMAVGIMVMLYVHRPDLPELWEGMPNPQPEGLPIFPIMFISIACGAISGFHATQSPMMARCMTNECQGRPIFYGAMVCEGIVALIWAAAATYFFHREGFAESNAAVVVNDITVGWLGTFGSILAMSREDVILAAGLSVVVLFLGRYGLPLGAAHRGRFVEDRSEKRAETPVHLRSDVPGRYWHPGVQHERCGRLCAYLALLCMEQPDFGRIYPLGGNGMAVPRGEMLLDHPYPGAVHDGGVHLVSVHRSGRIFLGGRYILYLGWSLRSDSRRVVCGVGLETA